MADAIIKISWRRLTDGSVQEGPGAAVGGICGTCFTLTSGITLSCAHHLDGLFSPNDGYDACRVWIAEASGKVTEIKKEQILLYYEYDAAVIKNFTSVTRYTVSTRHAEDISKCDLLGYEAHQAPFSVTALTSARVVEPLNVNISAASQKYMALTPSVKSISVKSNDVNLKGKLGFLFDVKAKVGLSGGPMRDTEDSGVAGICSIGLPADVFEKTQIVAIDLRA